MSIAKIHEAVLAKKLRKPGEGKAPKASLSAAIGREIAANEASRFPRVERGRYLGV